VILGMPKRAVIIGAILLGVLVIYVMGSGKQSSAGAPGGGAATGGCHVTVTADVLNVREAPDAGAKISGKYQRNAQVSAQPEVQNGYRKLADDKWAKADYLQPVDGSGCG
jgi:hypothetical protein